MQNPNCTIAYSVSLCRYTCAKANWDSQQEKWMCSEHRVSDCVNTFRNMSLLDELTENPASTVHPDYPSAEDIAEQKRLNESNRIYHVLSLMLQRQLSPEEWEDLNDRCDQILEDMGIEYVSTGGPIPAFDGSN